jgi:hypothetical protein
MKDLPFCYGIHKGSVCGESKSKKFHSKKVHICKKCSEHLTAEDIIPLEFFEMLAKDFMKDWKCDKIKTAKMYKELLKEYPFCIIKDETREYKYEFLELIINNDKEFNEEQKFFRLTAVFLDLMMEYLGTTNQDIGVLTDDYIYKTKEGVIDRISVSYKFYKENITRFNEWME